VNRIATDVPGLDLVLNGGLEPGAVVVLAGAPGTGKTILAQQMCFASATPERKCVYYTTMSEPHTKLVRHLRPFTFFDPQALGARVEHIHLGDFLRPARAEGLGPLVSEIVRKTLDEEPAIVVVDSAKMLRDFADERELRTALFDLTGRLAQTDTVLLLLGEYTSGELLSDIEFSVADGIIQLEYEPREPVDRRWLRVTKMRGGSHRPGKHTFQIGPGGIEVFPRIETLIPASVMPVSGRVRSGIPGLDDLMAGGTRAGDATLVMGPSGVGKTIFGLRWAAQELEQGNRCLYVTFQDTADQLTAMAAVFGWDLEAARAAGRLVISHVPMGDLDLDVLANAVRAELAQHPVGRVIVDSMAELVLAAREWERFPAYMRSLVGLIRAAGSSSLLTSETMANGLTAQSLDGLMFLFDNVIDLRYIEQESQTGRSLNVVKMRNSRHEMTLNSFTITDQGLVVGDKLEGVTGRLGWGALRAKDPADPARPAVPAPAQASLATWPELAGSSGPDRGSSCTPSAWTPRPAPRSRPCWCPGSRGAGSP
jgi:circadian clock protein KaiC